MLIKAALAAFLYSIIEKQNDSNKNLNTEKKKYCIRN